mgnify:CR=1 FL=1
MEEPKKSFKIVSAKNTCEKWMKGLRKHFPETANRFENEWRDIRRNLSEDVFSKLIASGYLKSCSEVLA